jgi:hypothetical protein
VDALMAEVDRFAEHHRATGWDDGDVVLAAEFDTSIAQLAVDGN